MKKSKTKIIKVDYLARVEGEAALMVKYNDNGVQEVKLKIFEPPRFFESFLRGRDFKEAPDITARICGICPIAYQMSAVHAMENALGVKPTSAISKLRRLIYCGEWIESHMLHITMLHGPDFLGYESAILMAKDHPEILDRGLKIKKIGNSIVEVFGGRSVHPINVRVGGFYRLPEKRELGDLIESLKKGRDQARDVVRWASKLSFPEFERNFEFVALSHPEEYPMNHGRLVSSGGLNIPQNEFENHFEETQVDYTNALHCTLKNRGSYLVGPMARFNLNYEKLSSLTKEIAGEIKFPKFCKNPFKSIVIRSLEVLYAFDEALRILEDYERPEESFIPVTPKNSTGYSITEAPRGILYHHYSMDDEGKITNAKIVPPTSQNQKTIEEDLKDIISKSIHLPNDKISHLSERTIRNYDPCISCATHFLKVKLEKTT